MKTDFTKTDLASVLLAHGLSPDDCARMTALEIREAIRRANGIVELRALAEQREALNRRR